MATILVAILDFSLLLLIGCKKIHEAVTNILATNVKTFTICT